jgi:flagellar biosynthetic protein FliR
MPLDAAANLTWPFGLVLARVTGIMLTMPFFSSEMVPVRARVALTLVLSIALTLATQGVAAPVAPVVALVGELMLGAAAGLVVRIGLAGLELAGELVGLQAGFGFSRTVDPMLESQTNIVGEAFSLVAGAFFFAIDGHRQVIHALADSLKAAPPGTIAFDPGWLPTLVDRMNVMWGVGLRIGAPVLVALVATQLAFALMSRVAPQLNLWGLGFVLTIGIGLGALALYAPALSGEIRELLSGALGDGARLLAR